MASLATCSNFAPYSGLSIPVVHTFFHSQRIMSNALTSWTTRVIELRARAISVTQTRENQIIRNCLTHWLSKSRQNVENLSLVDSFVEIQEEEMLRGKFRKWLSSTRRKIKLRVLLEEKLENDDRNLVSGVFDRWFDVYKERQLIDKVSLGIFPSFPKGLYIPNY